MMTVIVGLSGSVLTLAIFLLTMAFKTGQHSERINSLEEWRKGIRTDMHEISDHLEKMSGNMIALKTALEERTERTQARLVRIENKLDQAKIVLEGKSS